MPVLVSCRHCKRAVLISAHVTEREIGALADHLAACEPPVRVVGGSGAGTMMNVLRYFRVAEIERDRRADRATRGRGRYVR